MWTLRGQPYPYIWSNVIPVAAARITVVAVVVGILLSQSALSKFFSLPNY